MAKRFTLFLLCALLTQFVWAQRPNYNNRHASTIRGTVTTESGEAIATANVVLEGTAFGAYTDEVGNFEILNVPSGTYQARVFRIGFQSITRRVELRADEVLEISFNLPTRSNEMAEVEVFGAKDTQPEKLETITRLPLRPSDQIQSISIISDRLIQQQGALTISDATRNVPGVYTYATYGNQRESMSSRGFRGIPILKNGVRINSDFRGIGVLTDVAGVESMQVLKGAAAITQGVATDLGSPGGIINIVTKTPKFEQGGAVSLRVGSWGQVRPTFDVYGPINESKTVAFRLAGAYERSDSYRKGISLEKFYINPSLEWRPDDKTAFTLEMDFLNDSRTPDLGTINLATNDVNAIYGLPYDQFLGFDSDRAITRNATYTARFTRQLNEKINVRAAYFVSNLDNNSVSASLSSGTGGSGLPRLSDLNLRYRTLGSSSRVDNNSVLQFDLIGKDVYTGFIKHTFQVGIDFRTTYLETANGSMGNLNYIDIIDVFSPINNQLPGRGFVYVPAVRNAEGQVVTPARTDAAAFSLNTNNPVITRNASYGLMAQDVISVTDWSKLFLGLRYSSSENTGGGAETGVTRADAINPQLGIMLTPTEGINLFASYTNSSDPRSATRVDENGQPLGNERIDQVEAGIKSEWLNNRLRFNLTLYKINNRNMNMPVYDINWNETGYFQKGGNDERKGIEAELTGRLLENLEVIAGYALIDAKYKEHASYYYNSAPNNTPKHTANLWANYTVRGSILNGLSLGGGVYYVGERPNNDWARTVTHQGIVPGQKPFDVEAYTTINLQASYNFNKHIGLRLLADNIANEIGYNAYRTSWINQTNPRSFSGIVTYRF
ncbi:TonB-dependent receptor [Pontibacter sp. SGAir0037]|uniref:TonB-dependent receptor n=1 Tax=Pontibacter sp. SGAir0037 TaxID=2571030 RepID=UPI0010CCDC3E|nr:TonB-dependent receptor [Pontibacter sp. SGAir0037]QCR23801.1 TonB-dependent siderophore receptor [Pontibacter sp. SGAir0037]